MTTVIYKEECANCGGHGKATRPNTWSVDSLDRQWSRTYTEYVDTHCDDCDGNGYIEREE